MLDLRILKLALATGIVLQLGVVACGYVWPGLRHNLLFSVMMMSAIAGMLYGRILGRGFLPALLGGTLVGAGSGLAAVIAAYCLGERPDIFLPWGAMVSMLTGAVGGIFGELDARLRAWIVRKLGN